MVSKRGNDMRIAVVDEDEASLAFLTGVLEQEGHICVAFQRSLDMPRALQGDAFDLLMLDWNMPDLSAMDIMAWTKDSLEPSPAIIMLTSRSDKDDIAAALNAGADDFIVKPESAAVIAARVEAVGRRASGAGPMEARIETYGPYIFNRIDETVTLHGEPVAVTSKEFALARLFFANPHKPLSRRYLMETVWKSAAELSTRTLDMHVSRIRTKLQLRSDNGYRLQTVFGYGYRLERF